MRRIFSIGQFLLAGMLLSDAPCLQPSYGGTAATPGKAGAIPLGTPVVRPSWQPPYQAGNHSLLNLADGSLDTLLLLVTHNDIGKGPGINIALFHRSAPFSLSRDPNRFGPGWSLSYSRRLDFIDEKTIHLTRDDGGQVLFSKEAPGGGWACRTPGEYLRLEAEGNGWKVIGKDQSSDHFRQDGGFSSQTDASGNELTVTYQGGRLAVITDAAGRQTWFVYDGQGRIIEITDATDPIERQWYFFYGTDGRLSGIRFPYEYPVEDPGIRFVYDAAGRITRLTDRNQDPQTGRHESVWGYVYEGSRLSRIDDPAPLGTHRSIAHTQQGGGSETRVTERRGQIWTYAFDAQKRLRRVTDPLGSASEFVFDAENNLTRATVAKGSPSEQVWLHRYDARGNRTAVTDPVGRETLYTYDVHNNLTSVRNPAGTVTTYEYRHPLDPTHLTEVVLPDDGNGNAEARFRYEYYHGDALPGHAPDAWDGQLKRITDPNGAPASFFYDRYGQGAATVEGPVGWCNVFAEAYDHTAMGTPSIPVFTPSVGETYPNHPLVPPPPPNVLGQPRVRTFMNTDWLGLPTQYATHVEPNIRTQAGIEEREATRTEVAIYDPRLRITTYTVTSDEATVDASGKEVDRSLIWTYDDAGGVITRRLPDGSTQRLFLDTLDRVSRMEADLPAGLVWAEFERSESGLLREVRRSDGTRTLYQHHPDKRIRRITHLGLAGAELFRRDYLYEQTGLIQQVSEVWPGGRADIAFVYDRRGRLIRENRTGHIPYGREYTYDQTGNRLSQQDALTGQTRLYFYDTTAVRDGFAENAYGSKNNRLMRYRDLDAAETTLSETYCYYGREDYGNISYLLVMRPDQARVSGNRFLYDENRKLCGVIQESFIYGVDGHPQDIQRNGVLGFRQLLANRYGAFARDPATFEKRTSLWTDYDPGHPSAEYAVDDGSGDASSTRKRYVLGQFEEDGGGRLFTPLSDESGSVRERSASTGEVMQYVYTAFGERIWSNDAGFRRNGFAGAIDGEEIPLLGVTAVRLGHRFYLPSLGRWLQRDPIGWAAGTSVPYAYVGNCPTRFLDPSGLSENGPPKGYVDTVNGTPGGDTYTVTTQPLLPPTPEQLEPHLEPDHLESGIPVGLVVRAVLIRAGWVSVYSGKVIRLNRSWRAFRIAADRITDYYNSLTAAEQLELAISLGIF